MSLKNYGLDNQLDCIENVDFLLFSIIYSSGSTLETWNYGYFSSYFEFLGYSIAVFSKTVGAMLHIRLKVRLL